MALLITLEFCKTKLLQNSNKQLCLLQLSTKSVPNTKTVARTGFAPPWRWSTKPSTVSGSLTTKERRPASVSRRRTISRHRGPATLDTCSFRDYGWTLKVFDNVTDFHCFSVSCMGHLLLFAHLCFSFIGIVNSFNFFFETLLNCF